MNLVYPNESDWVRGTDDNELTFYGHHCLISKLDEFLLLQFLYFAFWQPLVNGNEASSKAKFNRLTKLAPIIFNAIFSLRWFLCSTRIRKTFLISQAHFSHTSNYFYIITNTNFGSRCIARDRTTANSLKPYCINFNASCNREVATN